MFRCISVFVGITLLFACGSDSSDNTLDTTQEGPTPGTVGATCTDDSTCNNGLHCDSTKKCAKDATPTATCKADSDCADGDACDVRTGTCGSTEPQSGECTSRADCAEDETCDSSGTCVPDVGCTSDADCGSDQTCDRSGECVGIAPPDPTCHECACETTLALGGCADLCDATQNGTNTPNFCQGVRALTQCEQCLQDMCGWLQDAPDPNDPFTCQ